MPSVILNKDIEWVKKLFTSSISKANLANFVGNFVPADDLSQRVVNSLRSSDAYMRQ